MKYRESGMPEEQLWDDFFNPEQILDKMGIDKNIDTLLDIGCGYGTFLIPSANLVRGTVIGIDIEDEMINVCKKKVQNYDLKNVDLLCGDVSTKNISNALEKYKERINYITLFNILHCEQPLELLRKAYQILKMNGKIGVIHWKYESTPRGPSMEIRPTPETIIEWATKTGFSLENFVELPPHHFGLVFIKKYEEVKV